MPFNQDKLTRTDVVNAYHLAHGREPETEEVIEEKRAHGGEGWLAAYFNSEEFRENVRERIVAGLAPRGTLYGEPPSLLLLAWAAKRLPLREEAAARLRECPSWPALFHLLFSDDRFLAIVQRSSHRDDTFLDALTITASRTWVFGVVGEVETIADGEIQGWAMAPADPDRSLVIELYSGGAFIAAGRTALFRRDIQERFGGSGKAGFVLSVPPTAHRFESGRGLVREAASGVLLGTVELAMPPLDVLGSVAAVRRDLAQLREMLTRLEAHLPSFNRAMGFDLASYDEYYHAYYEPLEQVGPGEGGSADLALIIDAVGASYQALGRVLASVARQHVLPKEVIIVYESGDTRLETEHVIGQFRLIAPPSMQIEAIATDFADWGAALDRSFRRSQSAALLFTDGQTQLSAHATELFLTAIGGGADLVFADEDHVDFSRGSGFVRHAEPIFHGAFDLDRLRQQHDVGGLLACRKDLAETLGVRSQHARIGLYDLVLRAAERPGVAIVNIPRILGHRQSRAKVDVAARLAAVEEHLSRVLPGSEVEPFEDVLGAPSRNLLLVRHPLPEGLRIALVIPTRDRLDLLGPCLASVIASVDNNRARLEVLVVDNQSSGASTSAFLGSFSKLTDLRVIEHDGSFNWALMNNRAAEQTEADVLVFLNNDTVVLSPGCWDELGANAMRPEVGAVGARLLYADGTIQHAGLVTGGWFGFADHEGVGAAGAEAGYLSRNIVLRQVSAVTGACLATRSGIFRELGGFDIGLPVEGNDTDYCMRVRKNGYRILYDPHATLYHFESKSRGLNNTADKQEQAREVTAELRARWLERFGNDPFYNPHFDRSAPPFTRLRSPPEPPR